MKKTLLILLFFGVQISVAQIVNIPDANFKAALIEIGVDTNGDGEIQQSEASSLTEMNVENRGISSLEGILSFNNLVSLTCGSNNEMTTIDLSGLINLVTLDCPQAFSLSNINLSGLQNLERLTLNFHYLTSIDLSDLTSLTYLNLHASTELSSIETTNLTELKTLSITHSDLTSLTLTNNSKITTLYLYENGFTFLDLSSLTELESLSCAFNYLTDLDLSNQTKLSALDCAGNRLETLNIKNGSIIQLNQGFLNISSNPNLSYICIDPEERVMIQNAVDSSGYTNCVVNSFCTFTPGGDVYLIQGNAKVDLNANGCDSGDLNFPFLQLKVTDTNGNSGIFSTDTSGNYEIAVPEGSYTIEYQFPYASYFDITPPSFTVDFPTDASPFQQDICLTPNGTYNDLQVTIIPLDEARPGFDTDYKIIYANVGTTPLSGDVTFTFEDDVVDFVSASTNPDTQSTGQLSWSFSNLAPLDFVVIDVTMNLNTPTETPPLNGGDILCYEATISPTTNDENATDNSFSLKQTVVNSFDPNDKTCLEGDVITPDLVGEYVHYLIRFENTGSASAVNIVVKDIIDTSKFDMSSFVPMTSSHEYIARVQNTNEVEFIFEGINLPFDDANNDGFVMFKIKTLPSLVLGDTFENSAEIYFDFNFPIITNTEQTTIDTTASTDDFSLNSTISVYPNPTSNRLQIKSQLAFDSVIIYDLTGKELKRIVSTQNRLTQEIDVSNLKGGVYYISIFSGKSKKVMKFIKA